MIETAILPSKGGIPVIDIQHVTKRYGALYALRDVSLHVEKGSVLGLLGQNGAGKTTLINILTGYLAPTEGWALLAGHDALLEPEEARKHLGYLPEVPPLYDEMTVREYLRFAARLKGVESRAVPAHVDEIMELCGLTQMQRRLLSHLSKGYRQRAGLAPALCGDPEILVLDDSASALDFATDAALRRAIAALDREMTVLIVSQRANTVRYADQIVVLDDGKAVGIGTHEQLLESCEEYQEIYWSQNERVLAKEEA